MRVKMRQLRIEKGYTQAGLAKELGISSSHYSQVEEGNKQPSLNLGLRIKKTLGYYGDDIFDKAVNPK